jgi:membrane fusion protein, multidrug efflux system
MPANPTSRITRTLALIVATAVVGACSKDAKGSPPESPADQAGGAKPAAAVGGGTTRTSPSITLAATDVATIGPSNIEAGVALTGDLRPIETIGVRARIEGDLTNVYVREGQQVTAGQLLARFEAEEQESSHKSAEADVAAARTDLANTQWTFEQDATLFKAGAIAERDYKNAEQAVATSRARLAATEARARATSNQARDTRVVAPVSGVIDKRMVEGSAHVAKGAELFTIVRNGTLELAAAVPTRRASEVRIGQTVHFVADAKSFDGRVARVSPTVDPVTRAITVYVEIPNPGGMLRGGTFATGRVVSRTLTNVLIVPTAALRQSQEDGKPFVYRIDGKTINVALVQLGVVDERQGIAQVTEGLQTGDRVIVGNVGTLGRGMQATIAGEEKGAKRQ